jgi:hypothetical protein
MRTALFVVASVLISGTVAAVAATPPKGKAPDMTNKLIAYGASAAPKAIGDHATIVRMTDKGLVTLRKGTNGWTCMTDLPDTPGDSPMCMDENGWAWGAAWMAHKDPPADKPGMAYMLRGATDASNVDPFMTKPADGKWVKTGPHVMILSAAAAKASGYPSGEKAPDTSKPYVMFGGTPYAHIMLPVK